MADDRKTVEDEWADLIIERDEWKQRTSNERDRCTKIAEEYQGPEAFCIADRIRRGVT